MEHSNAKMPAAANNRRCSSRSHSNRKRGGCFVCCRRFAAFLFSHVGLCGLVVGYSILGAFTFRYLEGEHEVERATTVVELRDETVSRLWEITDRYNVLYRDNWTVEVSKEMVLFQQRLIEAVKDGYDGKPNVRRWSLSGAFLYSLTVITTIGYGEIAPRTGLGKVVTILYAIFGIPLMLLYLANIGDILARAFRFTYGKMCTCSRRSPDRQDIPLPAVGYGPHNSGSLHRMNHNSNYASSYRMNHYSAEPPIEKSDVRLHPLDLNLTQAEIDDLEDLNACRIRSGPVLSSPVLSHAILNTTRYPNPPAMDRVSVPISLCLFIMIAYISGGAVLFSLWEDWGFLEAAYFCFVTLSTIGFGDFVPGVSDTDSQEKLVICSLYLLVGMVLIAMCFTLMQEEVVHKVRRLGKRLGLFHKEGSCGSCHQLHEVYPPPPPPLPHADLQELTGLTAPIPPPMREPGSDYTW